ncbi:hypothetical protein FSP39_007713 [Pinctada imbricata]|uniref:Uncharacterized protein n=1 Tax=Pinctada imbricata TaxID=66713 RepID=A0AA88XMR9_PINIB|nr:hypothetical protein FSP39_007713 [Pinctada imbricata]
MILIVGRESNGRKLSRGDEYFSLNQLGHVRMDFGCDRELSIAGSRCTTSEAKTDLHPMGCWSANIGRDKEIIENLTSVSEAQDRDVIKLTKELREANTILSSLHTNIESLQAERERSQTALEKVKLDYQLLQDEKSACQKQISVFKRYVGAGKIHDRRIVREIDQLFLCYDRLDQREKLMRKQISILEAELALVVLKLNVPKSHSDVAKSEKAQSQKLPVKKSKVQRAKVHHGSTLPNVSLTNKVCSKVPKEILNISNRSEGSNPLLSSRNESKSQKLGFRKFPRINMMANKASKEVSEIGKECKRLYEKGNDILKREAYSRRNQRINELLNSTTKSIDSREHRSRCISSNEIGQRRLPDICPYAIYQPRTS